MDLKLDRKIALITASTNGIGKAVAEMFLEEGATVIINGRNYDRLKIIENTLSEKYGKERIFSVFGDASDSKTIADIVYFIDNHWGKIDILIPCVGTGKPETEDKLDENEWNRIFNINLLCNVKLIKSCLPLLQKANAPAITLISSVVSLSRASAPYSYAAAKSAILSLNSYLAGDFAKVGIRSNCVVPGNVFFHGGRWEELRKQNPMETDYYIKNNVPMARFGLPEEIANAIVFLSSERASFINGAVLTVDGGQNRSLK
ncbi:MAG: SDR family oxidoreductase [Spirochaetaceae bacterium]|nr:SDR family oxidoreductase [Spirochaetaceae bacterium]